VTRTRVALVGLGKMGRAIEALAPERACEVVAALGGGAPITRESLGGAEVAVEFTAPDAAAGNVLACVRAGCPVVSGTTGWAAAMPAVRERVAREGGALLWAANFSVGVNLFVELARAAGALLGGHELFDVHLTEVHHAAKRDAPSGTAALLADAVGAAAGRAVPVTSVRTGSVPGTHTITFDAPFEQITLEHAARDRRVFADGALLAARWLAARWQSGGRGVFTMADVLTAGRTA
jgi:4-hydroxy-tetrahydrodipicolinate reductase